MRLSCGVWFLYIYLVAIKARTVTELVLAKLKIKPPRTGDFMSYQATKEYLMRLYDRYRESSKSEKKRLLSEAVFFTKKSRKHLIRMLSGPKESLTKKKSSGRPCLYPQDLLQPHIRSIWIAMERVSGCRMKAGLPDWLRYYDDPSCDSRVRYLLDKMSAPTLERRLTKLRGEERAAKGLSLTRCPSRFMKNKIPLNTLDHKIDRPGFTQADTVAHCGVSAMGPFASSLTLVDIYSAWTQNMASLTKTGPEIRKLFIGLRESIPYELEAVNVDNGSEFLNGPVMNYMAQLKNGKPIIFTRSREYKKNDQCYVEQKNFTHVRELFGYDRVETPELVLLMNDIYKRTWNPLQNFFIPTYKIKEKIRVGSKIKKIYDKPKTPFQRLIESEYLTKEQKQKLEDQKKELNPFTLARELEKKLGFYFQELRKSKLGKAA
jgi:hypothetical protein